MLQQPADPCMVKHLRGRGRTVGRADLLVVGEAPGASKLSKARDLAIPMVPAAEFDDLLRTGSWRTVLS